MQVLENKAKLIPEKDKTITELRQEINELETKNASKSKEIAEFKKLE